MNAVIEVCEALEAGGLNAPFSVIIHRAEKTKLVNVIVKKPFYGAGRCCVTRSFDPEFFENLEPGARALINAELTAMGKALA